MRFQTCNADAAAAAGEELELLASRRRVPVIAAASRVEVFAVDRQVNLRIEPGGAGTTLEVGGEPAAADGPWTRTPPNPYQAGTRASKTTGNSVRNVLWLVGDESPASTAAS